MAQRWKHLPAMWETQVQSLSQEDPLEKEMATHSSILAWRIPWMRSLVSYSPWGRKESDMTEKLHFTTPWKEIYVQPRQHIKKQRHYFANKGLSSSHVWMWELDCEKSWEPKNWCFWTVVLQKTLKSLLQHHSSKISILLHWVFFMVQLSRI